MTDPSQVVHIPREAGTWPVKVEWARLDKLCLGVFDCPHTTPNLTASGPFVVRSQDIRTGIFRADQAASVSEATYKERIDRAEPRLGDLLFSREGTYFGVAAEVPPDTRVCLGQRMVLIRPHGAELNSRFLRYWLNSPLMAGHIASFKDGSVAERLNMPVIRGLPVPLIGTDRQVAIASILGALDDKIELNRRINETLEAMARAIFKDWFVDFGPTRAKMEGRAPYLAPEIWSLFPDRLDDDGKPEGWEAGEVSDLLEIAPSETIGKNQSAPYLDMAALPTQGTCSDLPISRAYSSGSKFRNGDTLLARITPCLENGKTAFVQNLPSDGVGWGSTEFIVMRTKTPVPKPVSYLIARDPAFRRHAIQSMTGTSGRQRANADAIKTYPATYPRQAPIWSSLEGLLSPIFAKIASASEESRTLAATRDLLLPKLMSGEIRVREAEAIVGAVA